MALSTTREAAASLAVALAPKPGALRDDTWLKARMIGDVRELTATERAIVDRIDLFGAASVGGLVLGLKLIGIGHRETKRAIRAMLADGKLAITR